MEEEEAKEEVRELRSELRKNEREFRTELLRLETEPTYEIYRRAGQAHDWLADWEEYDHNFPREGGLWDQPAIWKMALDCAKAARRVADRERKKEKEEQDALFGQDLGQQEVADY